MLAICLCTCLIAGATFAYFTADSKVSGNVTALALAYIGTPDLTVTGGTFTVDPTDYLAEGYTATESNGVWTVTKG